MEQLAKAKEMLTLAETLYTTKPHLKRVYKKIHRKVKAEVAFLEKCSLIETPKDDQTSASVSSNIPYLSGVLEVTQKSVRVQDVICEMKRFGIIIDVICEDGKVWKKVIARNPQSLHLIWAGKGQYGTKSRDVVKRAERYLEAASQYCEISPPQVVYVFCNGVTKEMDHALKDLGVKVEGKHVPVSQETLDRLHLCQDSDDSDGEDLFEILARKQRNRYITQTSSGAMSNQSTDSIFLDITTMIVYVTDLCNGGSHYTFHDGVLQKQASEERQSPALQSLMQYMNGSKELITCESAMKDFTSIVNLLGGENEKQRADELKKRITVVPDQPSARFEQLTTSGQIKDRSKVIFGTADSYGCEILTSNVRFVRAAAGQGIHISAIEHASRALSERKKVEE